MKAASTMAIVNTGDSGSSFFVSAWVALAEPVGVALAEPVALGDAGGVGQQLPGQPFGELAALDFSSRTALDFPLLAGDGLLRLLHKAERGPWPPR